MAEYCAHANKPRPRHAQMLYHTTFVACAHECARSRACMQAHETVSMWRVCAFLRACVNVYLVAVSLTCRTILPVGTRVTPIAGAVRNFVRTWREREINQEQTVEAQGRIYRYGGVSRGW